MGGTLLPDPEQHRTQFLKKTTDKFVRPTGFTRVRARSQGVCFLPRMAEADKPVAMTAPGVETSCSAFGRGGSGLIRELSVSLDKPPCSTLPTLLAGLPRSSHQRTPPPDCRTSLAVFTASRATRAGELRRANQDTDGPARPSPAFEQVATRRTATTLKDSTSRTRRTQRVLHEERDARQRPATGRKPHRHH